MKPLKQPFDTSYTLETPEGVDMQVTLAGPAVRTLAFAIDFSIRLGIVLVLLLILLIPGAKVGQGVFLLGYFLIEWWYPVVFETLKGGQTPGKKAMGIAVINEDLTPVSLSGSLIRNLLRAADFMPAFYVFGFICMSATQHFQRLGDIAASTIVIYKEVESGATDLPNVAPTPPPFPLSEVEQTAIVDLSLRHKSLSQSRQQELAEILQDSVNKNPSALLNFLYGIGIWLMGSRGDKKRSP